MTARRLATVLLVALLGLAPAASAGAPGKWTRVTATNIANFSEPGLARTPDGVLHVVWSHATSPSTQDLLATSISPAGAVGATASIQTGWSAISAQPAVVRTADGVLHVFFGGLRSTEPSDPLNGPLETMSSADGRTWGGLQTVSTSDKAYAGSGLAAALSSDGMFVTAEGDPYNGFQFGLAGATEFPYETRGCCVYDPGIAVDSATGAVVLGWFSNVTGNQGLYTRTISPSGVAGPASYVPGSATADRRSANQPSERTPLTGRIGAAGVYLAYGAGYPSFRSVDLLRVGGKPVVVSRGNVDNVTLAAAPEGRLWVMWEAAGKSYVVTRSNRAVTRFEPGTVVKPPPGTVDTFGLFGEGSRGGLDLLANVGKLGNSVALYNTQVRPRLSASARAVTLRSGSRRVTFSVGDAGDAVPGAKIAIAGRSLLTDAGGRATIVLRGHARATVNKAGYRGTAVSA